VNPHIHSVIRLHEIVLSWSSTGTNFCCCCLFHDALNISEYIPNITSIVMIARPPLQSSGQSSWPQIQRSGFDRPYSALTPLCHKSSCYSYKLIKRRDKFVLFLLHSATDQALGQDVSWLYNFTTRMIRSIKHSLNRLRK
jgi:hypothetical protein